MNIDNLTIAEIKQIAAMMPGIFGPAAQPQIERPAKRLIGQFVIVRCRDAGVHAGFLVDYEGRSVTLANARRLWRFKCVRGINLSDVAAEGLRHDQSRISAEVPAIILPEACEIIPTSDTAKISIVDAPVAEAS